MNLHYIFHIISKDYWHTCMSYVKKKKEIITLLMCLKKVHVKERNHLFESNVPLNTILKTNDGYIAASLKIEQKLGRLPSFVQLF